MNQAELVSMLGKRFDMTEIAEAVRFLRAAGVNASGFQLKKGPISMMAVMVARDPAKLNSAISELKTRTTADGTPFHVGKLDNGMGHGTHCQTERG